jgi:hypothetical protein
MGAANRFWWAPLPSKPETPGAASNRSIPHQVLNAKQHERGHRYRAGHCPGTVTTAAKHGRAWRRHPAGGNPEGMVRQILRNDGIELTERLQSNGSAPWQAGSMRRNRERC